MTHRKASSRLDLPQPFGPTTPVSPGSIRSSVGSTNDLKPINLSLLMCIQWPLQALACCGQTRKSTEANLAMFRLPMECVHHATRKTR